MNWLICLDLLSLIFLHVTADRSMFWHLLEEIELSLKFLLKNFHMIAPKFPKHVDPCFCFCCMFGFGFRSFLYLKKNNYQRLYLSKVFCTQYTVKQSQILSIYDYQMYSWKDKITLRWLASGNSMTYLFLTLSVVVKQWKFNDLFKLWGLASTKRWHQIYSWKDNNIEAKWVFFFKPILFWAGQLARAENFKPIQFQ